MSANTFRITRNSIVTAAMTVVTIVAGKRDDRHDNDGNDRGQGRNH